MNRFGAASRLPLRSTAAWSVAAFVVLLFAASASDGAKRKATDDTPDVPPVAAPELPSDLNQANLRVAALDTLYELDLSVDQLRALRQASVGTGSTRPRSHTSNMKFAKLLERFQSALLEGNDDQAIAKLRGEVVDQIATVDGLDDQLEPTGPAMKKAPEVCRKLKASQVAAFLASHADEVSDPAERMVEAVEEIRLAATPGEAANVSRKIAQDVARMVAGVDQEKSKAVADKVTEWLKGPVASKDELTDAQRAALEQSAAKVIGDVSNMDVLEHWLESEVAVLLSNPQLPTAIDTLGNVRIKQQQASPPRRPAAGGTTER